MYRVFNCLANNHDLRLVALAGIVCLAASFVGINLFLRARAIGGTSRFGWLLTAGGATGCGIWATHFIGLLAFEPGVPLNYDVFLTALSLVFAVSIVSAGFAIAIYVKDAWAPATGGGVVGAGTVAMHYTGMAALHPSGEIIWSTGLVIASILFAVVLSAAAMHAACVKWRWRIAGSVGALAASILLLHFTGMGAAGLIPDTVHAMNPSALSPTWLPIAVGGGSLVILTLCLIGAVSDRRAQRQIARQNALLDSAINNMNQGLCMFDAQHRLLVWNDRYREMYKLPPYAVRQGASIQDLLRARIEAGTFPLEPKRYEIEVKNALMQGKTFRTTIELADGRTISGVNQPIAGGGWVATHEDITDRVRAERELERTRSFLDSIISSVPAPIVVKELPDLRYRLVNKAAEKFFGIPAEGFVGKTTYDVFGRAGDAIATLDRDMLQSGREKHYDEHSFTAPNGETRILTSTRIPIMGADGNPQYIVTVLHDLTQRKRDEARISHMAHHDPLTDLPNRTAFNECLHTLLGKSKASGEQFALMAIDLDRFKGVNDLFGQAAGDAVLRKAARRLAEACEGAFLSRLGGDEFAVISPAGPQPETAVALAERLSEAMRESFDIDGQRIEIGATIGVAVYPGDGEDASTLVANADTAQVRAKSERRGSVHFFEPGMDRQLRERRALAHDLHSALNRNELVLNYQPIATVDGEITGFEALSRWHHPQRGLVRPDIFIPLAEETGLIGALGEWALRTACREAATWPVKFSIAVNLSPAQFLEGDIAAAVHAVLLETGLQPHRLTLEITEGVLMQDPARGLALLRRLKGLGVRVAMDDFGTGYSSLSYLQSFPFDKIKIDKSCIAHVAQRPQSAAIVRAVIGLAHGLGLPVLAEGVETEEQLAFLRAAGCDKVQGFLIGRPHEKVAVAVAS